MRGERPERLTPREAEVVRLLALGRSGPVIASELSISRSSVETHLQNLRLKYGSAAAPDMAMLAVAVGLIENPYAARAADLCPKKSA